MATISDLPSGVTRLGNIKGDKGEPGTLDFVDTITLPAGATATAVMVTDGRGTGVEIGVPRGAPGTNGVATDQAIADNLTSDISAAQAALFTVTDRKMFMDMRDYASLRDVHDAITGSAGARIYVPRGDWLAGAFTWDTAYWQRDNCDFQGEQLPRISANGAKLEAGSRIMGRFNIFANGCSFDNIGFDAGRDVTDVLNGGAGTDAFAFAKPKHDGTVNNARSLTVGRLVALARNSATVGHAALIEGVDGGGVGEVVGFGAMHAVAFKAANMAIGTLAGYGASGNNVILKGDSYASAGWLTIGQILAGKLPPGVTAPWSTPAEGIGLNLNAGTANFAGPIQIGSMQAKQVAKGLAFTGTAGRTIADFQLARLLVDSYGAASATTQGITLNSVMVARAIIDSVLLQNLTDGVSWAPGVGQGVAAAQLMMGTLRATNIGATAMYLAARARVRARVFEVEGAVNATYFEDDARLYSDDARAAALTAFWGRSAPALGAGWVQAAGYSPFTVTPSAGGVKASGVVVGGTSTTLFTLPAYLRPASTLPVALAVSTGGTVEAEIRPTGAVVLASLPAAGTRVSLSGLRWDI